MKGEWAWPIAICQASARSVLTVSTHVSAELFMLLFAETGLFYDLTNKPVAT